MAASSDNWTLVDRVTVARILRTTGGLTRRQLACALEQAVHLVRDFLMHHEEHVRCDRDGIWRIRPGSPWEDPARDHAGQPPPRTNRAWQKNKRTGEKRRSTSRGKPLSSHLGKMPQTEALARHRGGETIAEIARAAGVTRNAVYAWFARRGISGSKNRQTRRSRRKEATTEERYQRIRAQKKCGDLPADMAISMRRRGEPVAAIAEAAGRSVWWCYHWFRAKGVQCSQTRLRSMLGTMAAEEAVRRRRSGEKLLSIARAANVTESNASVWFRRRGVTAANDPDQKRR